MTDHTDRSHLIGLATDLYQLTMGASYYACDMHAPATFSLFVRRLPQNRSFLVAAGVCEALARLAELRFDGAAIDYLRSIGQIREDFLEWLRELRFEGDVWAVPEGRIVFSEEPIIEVTAPVIQAQIAETMLINTLHFSTSVASKAARCVAAAPGKRLIEFGLRRTPSIDASVEVARAAYLAGFAGTSNLLAGERWGIPVSGTVAHSFIQAHESELEAFRNFMRTFPGPVTLLVDTYDSIQGTRHAVQVARELASEGCTLGAIRIDSGDLVAISREARRVLDDAGFTDVRIIASGGLDEVDLVELTAANVPVDAYGVGTQLGTVADAPYLDMVYKLVEFDNRPVLKLSTGKQTLIGAKQVWRRTGSDGLFAGDIIAARAEPAPGNGYERLLEPVVQGGRITCSVDLHEARERHRREIEKLPPDLLRIAGQRANYPVDVSDSLAARQQAAVDAARRREGIPAPAG
jgi:nicotinate phosphoribosyltransferase